MKFKPQGQFVLLGIPREALYSKGYKGEELELTKMKIGGVLFPVIEVGTEVYQLEVGDQVLLPQEDGYMATILNLEDAKYILVQAFDIVIRLKRENELNEENSKGSWSAVTQEEAKKLEDTNFEPYIAPITSKSDYTSPVDSPSGRLMSATEYERSIIKA